MRRYFPLSWFSTPLFTKFWLSSARFFLSIYLFISKEHQKICRWNERICFSWAYSSFVWLKTIEFSTWCDGNRQQICGLCCLTLDHLQRVGVKIATWSSVLNTFLLFLFIVYGSNGNKPHKTSIRTDQFMLMSAMKGSAWELRVFRKIHSRHFFSLL